jgi:hypothetical protein
MTAAGLAVQPISSTPPSSPLCYADNIDATHPLNCDFTLSAGIHTFFAKLSFRLLPYRTYSSLTLAATGGASQTHTHPHSATHSHTWHAANVNPTTATLAIVAGAVQGFDNVNLPADIATTSVAPGTTDANTQDHTHSISGTSILGVAEGASTSITAIALDGTDVTASLGGGPWANDVVDLDLTTLMPVGDGKWHRIALRAAGLGRVVAILRLG